MNPVSERLIVHPAVLAEVWVEGHDAQARAQRFLLRDIPRERPRMILLDSVRADTLNAMRQSLAGIELDPMIATSLVDDVTETIDDLIRQAFVQLIPVRLILRESFIIAAGTDNTLQDSFYYWLAASLGEDLLLVAEPGATTFARLRPSAATQRSLPGRDIAPATSLTPVSNGRGNYN